jgi:hypothetical protein
MRIKTTDRTDTIKASWILPDKAGNGGLFVTRHAEGLHEGFVLSIVDSNGKKAGHNIVLLREDLLELFDSEDDADESNFGNFSWEGLQA